MLQPWAPRTDDPAPQPASGRHGPAAWTPARPAGLVRARVLTVALSSTKVTVVQLKSSGGSQPFSPLQ